jgi:hypothetical protein
MEEKMGSGENGVGENGVGENGVRRKWEKKGSELLCRKPLDAS